MTTDPTRATEIVVEQRHRDAAAALHEQQHAHPADAHYAVAMRLGRVDDHTFVQAFARFDTQAAKVMGDALREIIGDQVGDIIHFPLLGQSHDDFVVELVDKHNKALNIARIALASTPQPAAAETVEQIAKIIDPVAWRGWVHSHIAPARKKVAREKAELILAAIRQSAKGGE
ncbi:hypothetical protein HY78_18920 [Rhizorhabdus wittichii DC-6]|nr:hypothetical protein HY78_18920 [Rhizorhabdus wittichii DC-6]